MASPTKHAKLSASSAAKWINNPPTLWIEEGMPDTSSPFAAEGTSAHRLAELELKHAVHQLSDSDFKKVVTKFKETSEYYNQSMQDFVDWHVDQVMEDYNSLPGADMMLEQRVSFAKYAPGGFGTSDCVIASDGFLDIWDFKYGKGIKVSADHNFQLMLYALGCYERYGLIYDFKRVRMTISQPRLGNLSQFEMSIHDLLKWGHEVVIPAADDALNGRGVWDFEKPATWHFFKAEGFCKALAEKNLEIRKYNFKEANTLKPEEIADILGQKDRIEHWLKAVEYYATTQVRDGKLSLPGYKLVEGRSNRKITDKEAVYQALRKAGYKKSDIMEEKLLAITKLEKVVKPRAFDTDVDPYIIKPAGKPTLVQEDDKRPAIGSTGSAKADFENNQEEK